MSTPWHLMTIAQLGEQLRAKAFSCVDLAEHFLRRIEALNPRTHAFVHVSRARALQDAAHADAEFEAGRDHGPLHGIPYALKDLFDTQGMPTTCHSRLLIDNVPAQDSRVAAMLRARCAVLLGKLATHEFALGWPGPDLPFPAARNPWNLDAMPGGSSTGSGVAVAARMVPIAISTDTAGSIRWPASFCGAVGLKPSFGRVSRRGLFPLSGSLDHCGPITACVHDAALALQAIAGHDASDPSSADVPVPDFSVGLEKGVSGLRLAIPREFFACAAAPQVLAAFERAVDWLRDGGARISEVSLPAYESFHACGRVIMLAEAFSVHRANLRERPQLYGVQTRNRLLLGAAISAEDLAAAQQLRAALTRAVETRLDAMDGLVTVTTLSAALPLHGGHGAGHNPVSGSSTIQGYPFTVTGLPAMSVPVELDPQGLPLAVQVAARRFDEATALRIGRFLETASGWQAVPAPMP